MREIEFRGKTLCEDGGSKWVYGNLFVDGEDAFIAIKSEDISRPFDLVQVVPETVGQFTGVHDKTGSRIFEGDIVSAPYIRDARLGVLRHNANVFWYNAGFFIDSGDGIDSLAEIGPKNGLKIVGDIYVAPGTTHAKN